ncbi:hypothetical protein L596_026865 [Steinernema carpocapsae]|uniref:Uncharacterized protein n=1 Tax=Steinernema carpocapsae TaxID=34508 RepID=A0A4U5M2R9_STECR|nr:hypothetical protein L596_026865 [Steinernema carpocapsae]
MTQLIFAVLCLALAVSARRTKEEFEAEVAKNVTQITKKLEKLSKFENIEEDYKLIDDIAYAVHYWPFFSSIIQRSKPFQTAGYALAHQFSDFKSAYLHELREVQCPLTQDFTRKSENTTIFWLENADVLIFSMHKDSHKRAHDKCSFAHNPFAWMDNVRYIDAGDIKKSIDIIDKRFCSQEKIKETAPKVAKMEFTVYMLAMKICYEEHYKGNATQIQTQRERETKNFQEVFAKLNNVF